MGLIRIIRPDWPPGSNAALLETQRRCAAGYTLHGDTSRPMRLGRVLPAEGYVPAPEPEEATPRPPTAKDRLLALLRGYGEANIPVPAAPSLAERLGVTKSAIYDALRALRRDGVVRPGRNALEVDGAPVRRAAWGGRE